MLFLIAQTEGSLRRYRCLLSPKSNIEATLETDTEAVNPGKLDSLV
jgi:hypothetical protein